MKYIRTKDGRILDNSKKEYVCKVLKPYGKAVKYVGKKEYFFETYFITNRVFELLKSADTIEELCDGYVIVPNTEYGIPFTRRIDDFDFIPTQQELVEAIYGFIKTDRGLIYVAKMNDKGELELI